LVQPLRTATGCEFELVPETDQVLQRAQTLDPEEPPQAEPMMP
jgi:hypothetical protein